MATSALPLILGLRLGHSLPLHIGDSIRPASAERFDVIHNVARTLAAGVPVCRARVLLHEQRALMRISVKTVEGMMRRLFERYSVGNRTELVRLANTQGWLTSEPL